MQTATSALCYAGFAVASIFDEDIRSDMDAIGWNPFNEDDSATMNSQKVSFYKGVPVFRIVNDRSASFAAIFLKEHDDHNGLRHERGHNTQLMTMGIANYGLMIGLPSWQEWSKKDYYDRPWEITADICGNVTGRPNNQLYVSTGYAYWGVSAVLGVFGYLFLFGEY